MKHKPKRARNLFEEQDRLAKLSQGKRMKQLTNDS